jgi:putative membrane protein
MPGSRPDVGRHAGVIEYQGRSRHGVPIEIRSRHGTAARWSKKVMRISNAVAAAAGATVGLLPTWAWAQGPSELDRYAYGPHMMWWGGGWYGMMLGPLLMILVLAIVIALAVLLVRWLGGPWQAAGPHQAPPARTPLDILKERFARGEIDKEEFEERRRVLGD